jgi:hypothetical protein
MNKAVLISIQPKWCDLIASGEKMVEVRKTKPKLETPFKVYIYETQGRTETPFVDEEGHEIFKGRGQVIGEFVCDQIDEIGYSPEMHGKYISDIDDIHYVSCVDFEQMFDYLADGYGYGWHITDLVIYDEPKDLREFKPYNRTEDDCKFSHLGFAIPKCEDCHECYVKRPPQSWCYVEELKGDTTCKTLKQQKHL